MLSRFHRSASRAFTLVEMISSTAVLLVVLLLLTTTVQRISLIWSGSRDQNRSFQSAQRAFDTVFRTLEQATLNTYWTTLDASGAPPEAAAFVPAKYGRMSELHFVAGQSSELLGTAYGPGSAAFFQAPLGFSEGANYQKLENSLNTCGYFVEFGENSDEMPAFLRPLVRSNQRYRLMELRQPTEQVSVYSEQFAATDLGWFKRPVADGEARAIGENIILIVFRWIYPKADGSLEYSYTYNSRAGGAASQPVTQHQLPPRAEVTLVALDEASAMRANAADGSAAPNLVGSTLFVDPAKYEDDRDTLEKSLVDQYYRFHTFSGEVFLKTAKWSVQ